MQLNLSCVVPVLIFAVVALLVLTVMRRFIFAVDELAMVGLVINGLRDVVGVRRFTFGCLILVILAVGFVIMVILGGISIGTCFSNNPSEFCRVVPFFTR